MKPILLMLAILVISTLSFWAGETGRSWIAVPLGVVVGAVVIAVDLTYHNSGTTE